MVESLESLEAHSCLKRVGHAARARGALTRTRVRSASVRTPWVVSGMRQDEEKVNWMVQQWLHERGYTRALKALQEVRVSVRARAPDRAARATGSACCNTVALALTSAWWAPAGELRGAARRRASGRATRFHHVPSTPAARASVAVPRPPARPAGRPNGLCWSL